MKTRVFRLREDLDIFGNVPLFVAVNVVRFLTRKQRTAKHLFRDKAMFVDVAFVSRLTRFRTGP
jgi:hypothetical protein